MKRYRWQIVLIISLLFLSGLLYYAHYLIFRDPHHIFLYLVGDIAFIPVEVLIVTLIIHQLLSTHEKRAMLKKLNMAVGAFFSEVGTELLRRFGKREFLLRLLENPNLLWSVFHLTEELENRSGFDGLPGASVIIK